MSRGETLEPTPEQMGEAKESKPGFPKSYSPKDADPYYFTYQGLAADVLKNDPSFMEGAAEMGMSPLMYLNHLYTKQPEVALERVREAVFMHNAFNAADAVVNKRGIKKDDKEFEERAEEAYDELYANWESDRERAEKRVEEILGDAQKS